ncbi:hypothetical protein [Serratia plymuthica]|uniref:hypothetical protein n=1 Tax=Serratia plymuthica TaxID=82996 RepID=UPI00390C574A
MDNKEKLRERIKSSLDNANNTLELKEKIEVEIANIMKMVTELTDGVIEHEIRENISKLPSFHDCEKLVSLHKIVDGVPYGFTILGFSLNYSNAYPVTVETENEIFDCQDEDALKDTIASIIDKRSLRIMQLVSKEVPDLPF